MYCKSKVVLPTSFALLIPTNRAFQLIYHIKSITKVVLIFCSFFYLLQLNRYGLKVHSGLIAK